MASGWRRLVLAALGWGLPMAAVGFVGLWFGQGNRLLTVQTGSMRPLIHPGDAVLVRPVRFANLRPGQIVSYRDSSHPNFVVTHRIKSLDVVTQRFTTKGDANPQPDLPVESWQLIGQATMVAPWLGRVVNWLRRPVGLIIAIYVPTLTWVVSYVWWQAAWRPAYRLRSATR